MTRASRNSFKGKFAASLLAPTESFQFAGDSIANAQLQ